MLTIRFDYDNARAQAVGEHGLSAGELDAKAAAAAVGAFRQRVDAGEVGFPALPEDRATLRAVEEFADGLRDDISDVLLIGIGGSALGPYALDMAMRGPYPVQHPPTGSSPRRRGSGSTPARGPRLVVLDNVDPGFIAAALDRLNPRRTAVCVIAKSGSTAETISTFLIVRRWMLDVLGKKVRERIIAITDAHKGDLLAVAKEERYPLFFIPENVGGRFSVFTPVGLVPAALIGIDITRLLRGAKDANAACWSPEINHNPALASAAVHHALDARHGKHLEIVFAYSTYLWATAFWYRQLWAESLGKRVDRNGNTIHTGQTPVAALGVTDQHSQLQLYMEGPADKMITFWGVERPRVELQIPPDLKQYDAASYLGGKKLSMLFRSEFLATQAALTTAGRPNCRWMLPKVDEYNLGAFMQMLEFQTAFAGELYGINAFDQPGVELGKKMTYGLMGRKGYAEFAEHVKG